MASILKVTSLVKAALDPVMWSKLDISCHIPGRYSVTPLQRSQSNVKGRSYIWENLQWALPYMVLCVFSSKFLPIINNINGHKVAFGDI